MYSSRAGGSADCRWSYTRTMCGWSSWASVCGSLPACGEIFSATSRSIDFCRARNTRANAPLPSGVSSWKSSSLSPGFRSANAAMRGRRRAASRRLAVDDRVGEVRRRRRARQRQPAQQPQQRLGLRGEPLDDFLLIHRPPADHAGLQLLVDHVDRQLRDGPELRKLLGVPLDRAAASRWCCQRRSMSSFTSSSSTWRAAACVEIGDELAERGGGGVVGHGADPTRRQRRRSARRSGPTAVRPCEAIRPGKARARS